MSFGYILIIIGFVSGFTGGYNASFGGEFVSKERCEVAAAAVAKYNMDALCVEK